MGGKEEDMAALGTACFGPAWMELAPVRTQIQE